MSLATIPPSVSELFELTLTQKLYRIFSLLSFDPNAVFGVFGRDMAKGHQI
jgi:hypothetical protein